jgi:uncharacterized membrane protein
MSQRARLDRLGALGEPSVVQRPTARLFGGISNARLGLAYYAFVAAAYPFAANLALRAVLTLAAAAALATSLRLAYDLLFVARASCRNCWAAHGCNVGLAACIGLSWRY